MTHQRTVTYILLIAGAIILGGEYFLVRWYPGHKRRVADAALQLLPYQNDGLGIQMKIAAGIYGKVEVYPGGIKIYRPSLFGKGPSITLTTQANTTGFSTFSPQTLADWETAGTQNELSGYEFEHLTINNRDAAMIWQYMPQTQSMQVTARIMAPDRILQAVCDTGNADQAIYTPACDESLKSIVLTGPPSVFSPPPSFTSVN
ncbi:MAG TPA: hypothetical protein VKV79_03585 [Terriglobia bacterium]|nr:hypothetical protein [Terriglobia bacterium]